MIMHSEKITPVWILIATLCRIDSGEAVSLHQKPPVVLAKAGEAVTLHCTFEEKNSNERMVWYKQKPGQAPQNVAVIIANSEPVISPEFEKSGIQLETNRSRISLIIPHTAKDHEGTYFCGISQINMILFSSGTLLAVRDHSQPSILVHQTPVSRSVSPGEPVTLQCTVLSEIAAADIRVLWFRPSAGKSLPEIIFTDNSNSSRQCETSCVFNFSKNILNKADAGTYYCAVSTCGKILLGNGTAVNLVRPLDPAVICLGAAVGVCVVVISVQAVLNCKKKICGQCSAEMLQQGSSKKNKTRQDHGAEELNYVALNFHERKTKQTRVKKEQPQDTLYSEVKCSSVNERRVAH